MVTEASAPPPERADRWYEVLLGRPTREAVDAAAALLLPLRDLREFGRLCALAELVCRLRWDDAKARRLYAKGLIETRRLAASVNRLEDAKARSGEGHSEYAEFEGVARARLQAAFHRHRRCAGSMGWRFPRARHCGISGIIHARPCRELLARHQSGRAYPCGQAPQVQPPAYGADVSCRLTPQLTSRLFQSSCAEILFCYDAVDG